MNKCDDKQGEIARLTVRAEAAEAALQAQSSRSVRLRELATKLQRMVHEQSVGANPLFSSAHWQHHAAANHPEMPDDDSYLAFENCIHPDCLLIREAERETAPKSDSSPLPAEHEAGQ